MPSKPSLPKGTRDFGPQQMAKRGYIINTIQRVFENYGFAPVETPSMENLSVLTGKYGEEGDQLLFKILNSGDYLSKVNEDEFKSGSKPLTPKISEKGLRYDLTVPFARYVVMNQNDITFPFRRYQIQPVWRADRPQRGRYREFYQCDADIIGTDSGICDLEIVWLVHDVFKSLDLQDFELKFNNRKILLAIAEYIGAPGLDEALCVGIDKLDKVGIDKVLLELQSKGISSTSCEKLKPILTFEGNNQEKVDFLKPLIGSIDFGNQGLNEVDFILDQAGSKTDVDLKLDFDITLARGLSYYTGSIFEVKATTVQMGSITGGGRYDDLTGIFGLPGMSGIGISFGIDRIYDVLDELELFPESTTFGTRVMITNFGEMTLQFAMKLLNTLRGAGISSELYPDEAKMKKQFSYADKKNIQFVAIIGPEEANQQKVTLKQMDTGNQQLLSIQQVIDQIKAADTNGL
ncbi:MAG: histidine--tRNA ligase [Cyclobacteriaceae bacterium]